MGKRIALLALLCLICATFAGCASKNKDTVDPTVAEYQKFRRAYDGAMGPEGQWIPDGDEQTTNVVLARAHRAIGTRYVFGGSRPGGFDCSGLVQWAYKGAGVKLPRTAREQSREGFAITDPSQMRAGDIVAFRRAAGSGYHTGIYIGDGKFIHAPSRNKRVRIESLSTRYFARNFIGARRVDTSDADVQLAEATRQQDAKFARASADGKSKKSIAKAKSSKKKTIAKAKSSKKKTIAKGKSKSKKKTVAKARPTKKKTVAKSKSSSKKTVAKAKSSSKKSVAQSKSSKKKTVAKSRSSSKKTVAQSKSSSKKTVARGKSSSSQKKTVASNSKSKPASGKSIRVRPSDRSVDEVRAASKG